MKHSFGQSSNCISECDTLFGLNIYSQLEVRPEYPGGEGKLFEFIYKNLKCPLDHDYFQSKVYVTFVIDTLGKIQNACIYKPYSTNSLSALEEAMLNVIKLMPNWKPGEENSEKVLTRIMLPINITFK